MLIIWSTKCCRHFFLFFPSFIYVELFCGYVLLIYLYIYICYDVIQMKVETMVCYSVFPSFEETKRKETRFLRSFVLNLADILIYSISVSCVCISNLNVIPTDVYRYLIDIQIQFNPNKTP